MSHSFSDGKFTYDTYVFSSEGHHVRAEITLDLNHPGVRDLIVKAISNKSKRSSIVRGALVVKVSR